MRILVVGSGSFTARYLIPRLEAAGDKVQGIDRVPDANRAATLDATAISAAIRGFEPQAIYHLAGSFSNEYDQDYQANVILAKQVLDAVRTESPVSRVLLLGSAAEYGAVGPGENPVAETHPLRPVSIYGLTKVFQTHLMQLYHALYGLDVVLARPFNLLGRGLSERLFVGRVYGQITELKAGKIRKILVGNLQSRRDYLPIEQAVGHYRTIMARGVAGEVYNVGAGVSVGLEALLKEILQSEGLTMADVERQARPTPHQHDVADIYADITKLRALDQPRGNGESPKSTQSPSQ